MRAAAFVEALSATYNISLLVASMYDVDDTDVVTGLAAEICRDVEVITKARLRTWLVSGGALPVRPRSRISRIHIFRVVLAPCIKRYLEIGRHQRATCTLDLDDYESKASHRMADLLEKLGRTAEAKKMRRRAEAFAHIESMYLPRFDAVYVCHREDQAEISVRYGHGNIVVAPNVVRLPRQPARKEETTPFTILFVGAFGYWPNVDAVTWFCGEVIPLIRRQAEAAFRFLIAGRQPTAAVQALAAIPEVTVVGEVASLEPYYDAADLAVAPIRAGGGTRIKILEALSFGCPVVSTSLGAEGLDVSHGREVLIGDDAEDLASLCVDLMRDGRRRSELGAAGLRWVSEHHSLDTLRSAVGRDVEAGALSELHELDYPWDALPVVR